MWFIGVGWLEDYGKHDTPISVYELILYGFISYSCSFLSINHECAENNIGSKRSLNLSSIEWQTGYGQSFS